MTYEKYFTSTIAIFLLTFILLSSTKAVNNYFYIFIAIPALLYFISHISRLSPKIYTEYLWLIFIALSFMNGLSQDLTFSKYCLYVLLFVSVLIKLVNVDFFQGIVFARLFFWVPIFYVLISTLIFFLSGSYTFGARIIDLPSRLYGPIYTSIFIASSIVLITPVWIKKQAFLEAMAGFILALICIAFILQSRSGVVGILLWATCISAWLVLQYKIKGVLIASLAVIISLSIVTVLFFFTDHISSLFERGDSGRLEIWKFFISGWYECGVFKGCGLDFSMVDEFQGQQILHPHNIYLTLGVSFGVIPLALFMLLMLMVIRLAYISKNWWGGYLLMALILFNFDGATVINSPNELWLLIWMPLGLIINYYLKNYPSELGFFNK